MNDKENRIKEDRLKTATLRNLTGLDGKIGQILKYMGDPVITQESGLYSQTKWDDVYEVANDDMPTLDMEMASLEIGKVLSALKWGINMELSYLKSSLVPIKRNEHYTEWVEADRVMTVTHKGVVVYREIEGDLDSYLPNPEWEGPLDRIYETCKKIKKDVKGDREEAGIEQARQDKMGFIAKLRDKWGI